MGDSKYFLSIGPFADMTNKEYQNYLKTNEETFNNYVIKI